MPKFASAEPPAPAAAEEPEPPRGIAVEVVHEAGDWAQLGDMDALIAPVLAACARHAKLRGFLPAEACLALADDAAMRRLNANFRAKDKPTNVLSFPSGLAVARGQPRALGDIVLGLETVLTEAAEQGISPADHVRHLTLHGLLHLLGHDHQTDAEAEIMEALEIEILEQLGIANPYEEAAAAPVQL